MHLANLLERPAMFFLQLHLLHDLLYSFRNGWHLTDVVELLAVAGNHLRGIDFLSTAVRRGDLDGEEQRGHRFYFHGRLHAG